MRPILLLTVVLFCFIFPGPVAAAESDGEMGDLDKYITLALRSRAHEDQEPVFRDDTRPPEAEVLSSAPPERKKTSGIAPYVEGALMSMLIQDWFQSQQIIRNPHEWNEENPLLGEHPSRAKMTAMGTAAGLGHYWAYDKMSNENKLPWALIPAIIEAYVVNNNRRIGMGKTNLPAMAAGTALLGSLIKSRDEKKNVSVETKNGVPAVMLNYNW